MIDAAIALVCFFFGAWLSAVVFAYALAAGFAKRAAQYPVLAELLVKVFGEKK